MNAVILAFSHRGCATAKRISEALSGASCYTIERLLCPGFSVLPQPSRSFYEAAFCEQALLVFVGSCGIAVRSIAPFVKDKKTDPAVIVVDELGKHVIPLLSGHIGGANAMAQTIAYALGAEAVITTATDLNGRFSVDAWAARKGYAIGEMGLAKAVSARILETDVPLYSEFPIEGPLPSGLIRGCTGDLGIFVGCSKQFPFHDTLGIFPPVLHIGIGCRKGAKKEAIAHAVFAVLEQYHLDDRAVCSVNSIDLKKDEPGLLAFCRDQTWPLTCYDAETLLSVPGEFSSSNFVRSVTGVDSVCERAAMVEADRLLVKKTIYNSVTVAVAAENLEVSFG